MLGEWAWGSFREIFFCYLQGLTSAEWFKTRYKITKLTVFVITKLTVFVRHSGSGGGGWALRGWNKVLNVQGEEEYRNWTSANKGEGGYKN